MLGKIIAWAPTREEALRRLDGALADTVVLGVDTNLRFLRRLLADPDVRRGDLHTGLIDALTEVDHDDRHAAPARTALLAGAAAALAEELEPRDAATAWQRERGWRIGGTRPTRVRLEPVAGAFPEAVDVDVPAPGREAGGREAGGHEASAASDPAHPVAAPPARPARTVIAPDGTVWVHAGGSTAAFRRVDRAAAVRARLAGAARGTAADPEHRAPMPGTVTAVLAEDGAEVTAGAPLVAVEAMKMEHRVLAALDGVVRFSVAVGDQVSRDQSLARVLPHDVRPAEPGTAPSAHEASMKEVSTAP
jgi:acetyl-CoA/propionyl-CoA carboxylase biotin carboxyl carrier protein